MRKRDLENQVLSLAETCDELLTGTLASFDAGEPLAFVELMSRLMIVLMLLQEDLDNLDEIVTAQVPLKERRCGQAA